MEVGRQNNNLHATITRNHRDSPKETTCITNITQILGKRNSNVQLVNFDAHGANYSSSMNPLLLHHSKSGTFYSSHQKFNMLTDGRRELSDQIPLSGIYPVQTGTPMPNPEQVHRSALQSLHYLQL